MTTMYQATRFSPSAGKALTDRCHQRLAACPHIHSPVRAPVRRAGVRASLQAAGQCQHPAHTAGCGVSRASAAATRSSSNGEASTRDEQLVRDSTYEGFWVWKGHRIRYQRSGEQGPAILLVHGFGANCDHWRKNIAVLGAQGFQTYAIDLLGYGYSDKPDPRRAPPNSIYCFETWGEQLVAFTQEVIQQPVALSSNSVGGLAVLQASILAPQLVRSVQLIDISLRGLHVQRQPPWQRPLVSGFQRLLRETSLGRGFFGSVAKAQAVKNILREAYGVKAAVTDELVEYILKPGLQAGAVEVFLDFVCYSGGPLPEELLAKTTVPVSMLWGEKDPWEDIKLGRKLLSGYPCVQEFVPLPGLGHCPHDEDPQAVNPLIARFARRHLESSNGNAVLAAADATAAA